MYLSPLNRNSLRNVGSNIVSVLTVLLFPVLVNAQDAAFSNNDSIRALDGYFISEDSLVSYSLEIDEVIQTDQVWPFSPDPNKAVVYAAIFPGLGQIYNKKYWKLPLVYGSAIGCIYAITWNGAQYSGYRDAYSDFRYMVNHQEGTISGGFDPNRNSWEDYIFIIGKSSVNLDEWTSTERSNFSNVLKSRRDRFRRFRDLSYIVSVGFYAIWIVDAYVDAQLFNFDISEDLSMNFQPVIFERNMTHRNTIGLSCSFNF